MATAREHFALDWIKADLLETLNQARVALDDYAEHGGDETRMRACLTGLHQVHGTLVMLGLKGVTQLADHLERLAQAMLANQVADVTAAGQALMQGILELPGYLDELQHGAIDSLSTSMGLVNEIRGFLELDSLVDPAGASLREAASDDVVARFNAIGGPDKVARIRSAYQNILLSILKGEDRTAAVATLSKIAVGLERVTEGAPLARQWQAFGEFVGGLAKQSGVLENEAVKLLRRVDLEIKNLAKEGEAALRRPVNVELVQQLLDAAVERDNASATVSGLQEAVSRDVSNNTLAISGRLALGSAAEALQEDLLVVKDKLDLLVRGENVDLEELRQLLTPLKQIGSTLSLLGFESSREIISDQIDAIESLVVLGDADPQGVQSVAGALVQIDENLSSVILGSGQTEVEQITGEAQLQVLREARNDLEHIKQCIVDFVTAHWSTAHLEPVPAKLEKICGALEIIPLERAISMLERVAAYVDERLMRGHRPEWTELDRFADVISAVDYYLERLADETNSGADDILLVAERGLAEIEVPQEEADRRHTEQASAETDEAVHAARSTLEQAQPEESAESVQAAGEPEQEQEALDSEAPPVSQEPGLTLEEDAGFDLSADAFAGLDGAIEAPAADLESAAETDAAAEIETAAELETAAEDEPSEHDESADDLELAIADIADEAWPSDESGERGAAPEVEAPDPEIVEIFIEEVDEVLETIAEFLPQWAQAFDNADALTEVRRAFHTLKGSGRIVQAVAIGELAWGIENMLNRVIDDTVTPNAQFVAVIEAALALVPDLRAAFAAGEQGDPDAIGPLIEHADVLASGGEIDLAAFTGETAQEMREPDMVETRVEADEPEQETAGADSEDVAQQAESAGALVGEEQELGTLELFIGEAREHLGVLQAENARVPWTISEPMARAFHTLVGGAALAELAAVQLIVEPAYQVAESFRDREPSGELQQFFADAARHLDECLTALTDQTAFEEPLEFVAAADDLLAARGGVGRAVDQLLDAPATAALFDAEDALAVYLDSGRAGEAPVNLDLQAALADLAGLAGDLHAAPLAELATALGGALAVAARSEIFPPASTTLIRGAYNQLIDQLNEIAAGGSVLPQHELVAALQALELDAGAEEAAQPEEQAEQGSEISELAELAEIDPDLVQVFLEEAEELNEELEANILRWSEERENRIYMENLLRGLHTMKGGARLCGLSKLGDMAHDFESIVIEVQNDERTMDEALFAELNRRYDEIANRLAEVNAQLDGAGDAPESQDAANVVELPVPETPREQDESSVSDVNKVVEAVVAPSAAPAVDTRDSELPPSIIPDEKAARAETASPERGNQEMVRVSSGLLEELVNLAGESSILRARIEQGMSDFTGALDEMETTIERLREQLRRLEIETETQILHRHERADGPQYENFDPLEMDRYNQLQQLSRGLSESASDMLDLKETLLFKARESETLLLQQARINTELQEGLMRTRMVPFSRLLPRLRRIVRQVATELDKEIDFHVQNAEGELDRNLLERMVPPLEHMLRNAVDHGIETAELRRNFGKSPTGRIDLRLTREGGDVVIEISDDGAGIDVEGVRTKAIERGLMAADAELTDEETLQFVLAPGFSTAKSVTQISGRGVGLDVVHSEVKQLGGSVNIISRPGKGSRFVIRVPFTVSVNRALMVSVADDLYAIPLNTIEGIVLLSPEQLQNLYNSDAKTFEYAGVPYRVRYLGQYLGREYRGAVSGQASVPMVLVRSGEHAVAIHVDLVQGSREIVVKSLGPQFAGVGGISGATILGDGSVVVILDLLALIRAQSHHGSRRKAQAYTTRGGPRCVMVVDDSVTVRKVTSRLLERQGMDVLVAKDGIEAVAMLQERRPDVMLLDIEMPRMDGFEVARQVRHDERLGNLPIVMISSRTGDKHKDHASQLGVNKFLGKPFQENELLATIDELVSRD